MKINRLLIAGIIIIVSFVYTINIQPVVFGSDTTFFLIIDKNYSYNLMSFKSYEDFSSFLNNSSRFCYNYGPSPGMILKTNIEIMNDFSSSNSDLEDIDFTQINIQVQGANKIYVVGIRKDADESIDKDKIYSDGEVYYKAILGLNYFSIKLD